ncbi:hypothetical protein [Streptomyces sp. NPDC017638]|uniref:hypothetical protein n=1 Tax=Streptomyces sp. NPDC017638 TaxID=3365004 RepID=UPI00379DA2C0
MHTAPSDTERERRTAPARGPVARAGRVSAWAVAALVAAGLLLVVVRLPWAGDLGMHAATLQRLRHSPLHPGNPLVDADTPSPYYSPWTLLLGLVARPTGLSVFVVLRLAALAGLALLVTGVRSYVRTLTADRAAPALALLGLLFLWGPAQFAWSGFLGLNSLALTMAYPSVCALGLAFHFWAWLTRAARGAAGRATGLGLGLLWALILLCHQFTGVVATLGGLAVVTAARPARATLLRLAAGPPLGLLVLWLWPYYDFFALFSAGADLEAVHRSLYRDPAGRFGYALPGVVALGCRLRRDRRDPLVLFFLLGVLTVAAGGLTGHWSWGRALPAALIPAQLAAALEVVSAGRRAVRRGWACVLLGALAAGAWAQAGTLGYVVRRDALPGVVAAKYRAPWTGYQWAVRAGVRYGDVVMARTFAARQIPAYGAYTVAPGYPDVFLRDAGRRQAAVERYFAAGTGREERRGILREYGVRWVVGGGPAPWLREAAVGPGHQILYRVVP